MVSFENEALSFQIAPKKTFKVALKITLHCKSAESLRSKIRVEIIHENHVRNAPTSAKKIFCSGQILQNYPLNVLNFQHISYTISERVKTLSR